MVPNFELNFILNTIKVSEPNKTTTVTCCTAETLTEDTENDARLFTSIGIYCRETFGPCEDDNGDFVWSFSPGGRWLFANPKHAILFMMRFNATTY